MLELGNLYDQMERLEEAAMFYRQAANIHAELHDLRYEGADRSNLANTLIKLHRYDEARRELYRAIKCAQPFGHVAESWKTWNILYDLELATGNPKATAEAHQKAIQTYLAYRRAGGVSQAPVTHLYELVAQAIQQNNIAEAEQKLAQFLEQDISPESKSLYLKLQAILHGDRNPALTEDPDLDYGNAVELQLLLESLEQS